MKYTCRRCCTIMSHYTLCPVCKDKEKVEPIYINVQQNVHRNKVDF